MKVKVSKGGRRVYRGGGVGMRFKRGEGGLKGEGFDLLPPPMKSQRPPLQG